MGSVSLKLGDGTTRFRRATLCSSALHLLMLASVLTTNLFAFYAFTTHPPPPPPTPHPHPATPHPLISDHISLILREIAAEDHKLHQISRDLSGYPSIDPASPLLNTELKTFLARHPLPLGPDSRSRITHLVSSVSHSCSLNAVNNFSAYSRGGVCPRITTSYDDLLLSCDPLPRRRCLTRLPKGKTPLLPFPRSLWPGSIPADTAWVKARGKNDFLIDNVLSLTSGVRIGLDVEGGDGNFAATMAERNVTVVTTTTTVSSAEAVAARGLIPLVTTILQRFPFQDSVFDLVHIARALDVGSGKESSEAMEFLLFDVDRVLRTGGLLWIDNYLCVDDERKRVLTKLIERFGYKKMKWVVGEKVGGGKPQLYLSAVLQKPARG